MNRDVGRDKEHTSGRLKCLTGRNRSLPLMSLTVLLAIILTTTIVLQTSDESEADDPDPGHIVDSYHYEYLTDMQYEFGFNVYKDYVDYNLHFEIWPQDYKLVLTKIKDHEDEAVSIPEFNDVTWPYWRSYANDIREIVFHDYLWQTVPLTRISNYAFADMKIETPPAAIEGIDEIGAGAFKNCSSLNGTLTIPYTVQKIEDGAFENCSELDALVFENDPGAGKTSELNRIGVDVFKGCSQLKGDLVIPGQEVVLSDYAFKDCTQFGNLTFASSTTYNIGVGAFQNCGFTTLTINNVTGFVINNSAFEGCSNLNSGVTIPAMTERIGDRAFKDCSSLTSLTITTTGSVLDEIGVEAFSGCSNMVASLIVPKNVTTIQNNAFFNCQKLEAVIFEGAGDGSSKMVSIGDSAFEGCTSITGGLIVPSTVTTIGARAFYGCSGMSGNLTILSNGDTVVTTIGDHAFHNAFTTAGDNTLDIGNNVMYIGVSAFEGCKNFSVLNFQAGTGSSTEELKPIGNNAFYNCNSLKTLQSPIPDRFTSIGINAFKGAFTVVDGDNPLALGSGLMTIGDYAFSGCKGFTGTGAGGSLVIPDNITSIGTHAFSGCDRFGGLTIGSGDSKLVTIGSFAFSGCTALKGDLLFPSKVTSIGESAFNGGYNTGESFYNLTLSEKTRTIGPSAFEGCSKFNNLVLSDGCPELTEIGARAFYNCSLIGNLTIPEGVTIIDSYTFEGCFKTPPGEGEEYKLILNNVTDIGANAFKDCTGFTSIYSRETDDSLRFVNITSKAFEGCSGISNEVKFSKAEFIGSYAFNGCSGISKMQLSSTIDSIGAYAFEGCTGLKEINIIVGCSGISSIAFPKETFLFYEDAEMTKPINSRSTGFVGYRFTEVGEHSVPVKMIRGEGTPTHHVTYDIRGGTGATPIQKDVATGETFFVQEYTGTKAGSVFFGWTYFGHLYEAGDEITMGSMDIILVADWREKHRVIYESNGGTDDPPAESSYYNDEKFTLSPYSGTKPGCVFWGWSLNGVTYPVGAEITMGKSDMTFTAYWKSILHVSFDIGEGSGEAPEIAEVVEGQTFTLPSYTGERPGYVNKGWLYNGNIYQAGATLYMAKKDITLMIRWAMVHHVTYDLNGGEGDTPVQADVAEGDQFTVKECTAKKPKHHFAGWECDSGVYDMGGIITMGTKDIVLVAIWEDGNPTHTVTYDINGGSGNAPVQADVEEGSSFAIKYYSGSKEGYRFEGWAYGDSVYQTGDRVTMDESDIVLTAVWKKWRDTDLSYAIGMTFVIIFEVGLMGVALYHFVFKKKM